MRKLWTKMNMLRFRDRLLVALMLTAIFPTIFIGVVSYTISSRQMKYQIQSAQHLMLKNAADNISKRLEDAKRVSELIQFYFTQLMLQSPTRYSSYDNLIRVQSLKSNLALLRSRFDVPRIQFFLSDENIYAYEGIHFFPFKKLAPTLEELGVFGELSIHAASDNFCFKPVDTSRLMGENEDSILLFRTIRSIDGIDVVAGYFVDISLTDFGKFAENLVGSYSPNIGADCVIINGEGSIFYSIDPDQINTSMDENLYLRIKSSNGSFINYNGRMWLNQKVADSDWLLVACVI